MLSRQESASWRAFVRTRITARRVVSPPSPSRIHIPPPWAVRDALVVDFLTASLVLVSLLIGLVIGVLVGRALMNRTQEVRWAAREAVARQGAARRSRATLGGQALEELAPLFPDFPYSPKDLRFIGDPIDYVVFDGLTEGVLREIVLLEVKSGRSNLKTSQRSVRDAVRDGNVAWRLYRVPLQVSERT